MLKNKPMKSKSSEGKGIKEKQYNFTGVLEFAEAFDFIIEAKNAKEAKEKAQLEIDNLIDHASPEFSEVKWDKLIIIK